MKKVNKLLTLCLLLIGVLVYGGFTPNIAYADATDTGAADTTDTKAVDAGTEACKGITEAFGGTCDATGGGATEQKKIGKLFGQIINMASFVIGFVCVIMIIIGGFKYLISGGDANSVGSAKNTIMYALIGLGVVLFAQVIVKFVIGKLLRA